MPCLLTGASELAAQDPCYQPAYRVQRQTVMMPQTVQRYQVSYETEYVEEEVTSFRPVLRTRTEEREYTVAKPVVKTSYREEKYTVRKPVCETSYRDEQVTTTRYVTETAEREEEYTTYRPVTETQFVQKQFTVQRPVVETQFRQQQFTVQRPVVETQFQTQQQVSMRPVTTVENQTIDTGGFVAQQVVQPGQVQLQMGWNRQAYAVPGPFGLFARVRGAPVLTPTVTPATVQTQMAWRPNLTTQQISRTSFVPEVQQVQVPVQVQRMQTEVVTQNVPVQVQRMETEVVTQNVPVQSTRMVATTEVRKVPYTVQRPVTETSTRRVPVQTQRWETEERVRRIPIQTTEMIYQTRREPVEIRYYEQEEVTRKVMRPVVRRRLVPTCETVMVPRQVMERYPLSYDDPFSPAIMEGYSTFGSSSSPNISSRPVVPEAEADSTADDIDASEESDADQGAKTKLEKVEVNPVKDGDNGGGADQSESMDGSGEAELTPPNDSTEVEQPELNQDSINENGGEQPTDAVEAGWKIRYNPIYAPREV